MSACERQKYDPVTLGLHAVLGAGVVVQLLLSLVMHVPAGRGMGVRDWRRQAFEVHAKVGLAVAAVCVLHWIWISLAMSRPGIGSLFPWTHRVGREALYKDLKDFGFNESPVHEPRQLAGVVHGLGLLAVSGSAVGGIINYFGYFVGAPIPRVVLHGVARSHIVMGYMVGTFLIGHTFMALRHRRTRIAARGSQT